MWVMDRFPLCDFRRMLSSVPRAPGVSELGGACGGQGRSSGCFAVGVTDEGGGRRPHWARGGAAWLRREGRSVPAPCPGEVGSHCGFSLRRRATVPRGQRKGGPRSLLESLELTESPLMINCLLFRVLFYQCLLQINNVKKLYGSSRRNISFFAYRQAKLKQRVLFK